MATAPAPGGGTALANATKDLFNEIKTSSAAVTPYRFLALLRQLFPQFAQVLQLVRLTSLQAGIDQR